MGSNVQYSNYVGGSVTSTSSIDQQLRLQSVFIPKTSIITNVGWRVGGTLGNYTADEYNGIGVYSMNNTTGDLTLLGKTANDATIWSRFDINTYGNKNFESPITLEKGIYFLAYLYNNSAQVTAPSLATAAAAGFGTLSDMVAFNTPTNTFLAGFIASQVSLPVTILSASVTKLSLIELMYYLS